jgi:hypothetical protein
MALRLLEHEVKDVRSALADLPTLRETATKEIDVYTRDEDGNDVTEQRDVDVEVNTFDAYSVDQHRILALVERIGEVYDVARAREIKASTDESYRRSPGGQALAHPSRRPS